MHKFVETRRKRIFMFIHPLITQPLPHAGTPALFFYLLFLAPSLSLSFVDPSWHLFLQAPSNVVAIKAITKKNLAKSQNLLGKEIKILKVRCLRLWQWVYDDDHKGATEVECWHLASQELTELHHNNVVALLDCKVSDAMHQCKDVTEFCLIKCKT